MSLGEGMKKRLLSCNAGEAKERGRKAKTEKCSNNRVTGKRIQRQKTSALYPKQ